MIDRVGLHGADKTEVIHMLADVRQEIADLYAAFTMAGKIVFSSEKR